ncbi:MAG: helix-turn-helix domain-containing protein [Bacteroidales bacterium]|nr:helix-turn-helix domain-containing protein [Bacteroidales bacterium]
MNLSYKWLDRNFARHIGIRPKEYASLQRFIHAYFAFMEDKDSDLMDIAINSGYYDQNHFTKEFKKYTGLSPLIYRHSLFCRKQNYF